VLATGSTHDQPSLATAVSRIVDAGQRLVMDRIDLARLDILDVIERAERGAALIIAGALFATVGWLGAMTAVVVALQPYFSLSGAAALIGGANLLIGGGLVLLGMQRLRGEEDSDASHEVAKSAQHKVHPAPSLKKVLS
jgi:hypothetical protein